MKIATFFIFFTLCFSSLSKAQPGFRGSVVTGFNLAQLDGDKLIGYKKVGVSAGIKVGFDLKKKIGGNVEMLFSQRGSRSKVFGTDDSLKLTSLNYFELPIYLSFKDWYKKDEKYYKMSGHLGISTSALINSEVRNEPSYNPDDFNRIDLAWIAGATYSFSKKLGMTVRFTRSFNKILEDDTLFAGFLFGYFWTFRLEYNI